MRQYLCRSGCYNGFYYHIQAGTPPAGETFEWHNALPISASNIENTPSAVVPGMYYAVYNKGGSPVCYSNPTPIRVITNTCPATTIDLRTAVDSTSKPTGYVVTFHTGIQPRVPTELQEQTSRAAATSATYYTALLAIMILPRQATATREHPVIRLGGR
ncbi:MAG: hypothetical protein U5N85_19250 [Arcicella sp.]|nr:hypothetical protein [Arcicella sp.]